MNKTLYLLEQEIASANESKSEAMQNLNVLQPNSNSERMYYFAGKADGLKLAHQEIERNYEQLAIFLKWLRDRLVNVYGESPNADFVLKLEKTIKQFLLGFGDEKETKE